jgi:hypothetical protein
LGTIAQNNADRDHKGRHVALRGEQHGRAKLTSSDVYEICHAASLGASQNQLSRHYGVSQSHIWRIVHGRSWSHLLDAKGGAIA